MLELDEATTSKVASAIASRPQEFDKRAKETQRLKEQSSSSAETHEQNPGSYGAH